VNKYKHLYIFGCSHSLNTNSIDPNCKSYVDLLADKLNISAKNVYNYATNGSSNIENLYYLNCINSNLQFRHPNNDKQIELYRDRLPREIYDDSLIIFQLTYWNRIAFQHSILKENEMYSIVPFSPHRNFNEEYPYYDADLTTFCDIFNEKLSNEIFLQRNSILSTYYTLKGISNEKNNISTLLLSWDMIMDDNIRKCVEPALTNLRELTINKGWTCDSELNNKDWHLSPNGNKEFSDYIYLQI
jgi:hypothetical protein